MILFFHVFLTCRSYSTPVSLLSVHNPAASLMFFLSFFDIVIVIFIVLRYDNICFCFSCVKSLLYFLLSVLLMKKLSNLLASLVVASSVGCKVIADGQKFVYPSVVSSIESRNKNFSLEGIVRENNVLYAGAGVVEITPYTEQFLAGYHHDRKNDVVLDELFSRCVVLSHNNKTVAFVSVDLLGLMNENVLDVRELVSKIKGNYVDEVIIASTHTHSAPDTVGLWGPRFLPFFMKSGVDEQYMSFVYDKIVESVYSAAKNVRPASLLHGSKQVSKDLHISKNKRDKSSIDRELSVLQVVGQDKKNIAIISNYACHPEVLECSCLSSDFVGDFNAAVEQKLGGVSVFLNGAIGGLVTVDVVRGKRRYHVGLVEEKERIGRVLAGEVVDVVSRAVSCKKKDLVFYRKDFFVKLDNFFFGLANDLGVIAKRDYDGYLKTEVCRVDVGDVQFVGVPGEIFPNVGLAVKEKMSGKSKFVVGLANDELGYIMRADDFKKKLYSYERSMSVGKDIGVLVEKNVYELLEKK